MTPISYTILYVADPQAAADWYAGRLGIAPVERSETFALFVLPHGYKFGLWSRDTVEPAPGAAAGGAETCMTLADNAAVDAKHLEWREAGVAILMPPTALDFGYGFVAADPDGHRLRAFAPAM